MKFAILRKAGVAVLNGLQKEVMAVMKAVAELLLVTKNAQDLRAGP